MPTFTIKGIPAELYRRLKRRAAEHRRSINAEVLVCLEHALQSRRIDPEATIARLDALQARLKLDPVTEDELRAAKTVGRP